MPNLGGPDLVLIVVLWLLPLALVLGGVYGVVRLALRHELRRTGASAVPRPANESTPARTVRGPDPT